MAQFVAVTNSSVSGSSPDGITWTARALSSSRNWRGLVYNDVAYCAVAYGSSVATTSPDGVTWTDRVLPSVSNWQAVAWNKTVFCAVADGPSTVAATSPDGITWTARTLPASASWIAIAWNGTVFCAIAQSTTQCATSPDGITWTTRTMPAPSLWTGVTWNGAIFCAIAYGTVAATSPDGITWTARTLPVDAQWESIAWNGTVFCAVADGTAAATSPDGITWTARTLPFSSMFWKAVAWNGVVFCAVAQATNQCATSPDGITWATRAMPATANWFSIVGINLSPSLNSTGTSDIALPAIEFAGTAITDTLGSSDQTLASIIALSEGYSGNSSSVTLASIIAAGSAIGGGIGSSLATLLNIQATGTARADFIYPVSVTSGMTVAAPAIAAWSVFVTGTGAFTTTASAPTIFWEVVTSTATATTTGTAPKLVDATVTASAVVAGTIVGTAAYHVSAVSLASIISGIQFLQDYWDGWAYNLNTGAPSTYEDFKFNSFARIGKNYYGCNGTGIHLLSGGTDAGGLINVTVTLGTSDLATDKIPGDSLKNLPAVYVNARSDEPLVLTCRTEGDEYSYTFRASKSPMAVTRVSPGKGLSGTLWQLELTNQLGSDVEIGGLEPMVSSTKRRI